MSASEHFLYPERTSLSVERSVRRFEEAEPLNLNEDEKQALLEWEEPLGEKLEISVKPSSGSFDFPIDFLLTTQGKARLAEIFSSADFDITELDSLSTHTDVKKFLYHNQHVFFVSEEEVDPNEDEDEEEMSIPTLKEFKLKRQAFREESEKFTTDRFAAEYAQFRNGQISFDQIQDPIFVTLAGSAKKSLARLGGLKSFRNELKALSDEIESSDSDSNDLKAARKLVLKMYQTRVNEYLAEGYVHRYGLQVKADILGIDELTDDEKKVLEMLPSMSLKNVDRLDKFLGGVEGDLEGRDYRQVASRLTAEARQKLAQFEMANIHSSRDAILLRSGLDPQKIKENPITAEELKSWFVEMFSAHDIDIAPETAKNSNQGWRLNIEKGRKGIAITGNVKKVNIPESYSSPIYSALPVARHEFGHVLQHENRRTIPLKLFEKRGADRGSVFAEAGGMYLEDDLQKEVFGIPTQRAFNVGYIFALDARLNGGSFKDCYQAFLDPQIRLLDSRQLSSQLSPQDYNKERGQLIRESFNRTLRGFRNSFALEKSVPYIGESRAAVYLEQLLLIEELKKIGHLDLAFIARTNFVTLTYLKQLGFLDESKLISEINIARDVIWPRIKGRFAYNSASS